MFSICEVIAHTFVRSIWRIAPGSGYISWSIPPISKKAGSPLLPAQITCSGYAGMILARKHFMKIGAAAHAHGAHVHSKHVHHASAANGHIGFLLSFGIVVGIILPNTYFVNMVLCFL
jgi:hypothetical protein